MYLVTTIDENNTAKSGFFDIYHPITSEARVKFEIAIYNALEDYISNQEN